MKLLKVKMDLNGKDNLIESTDGNYVSNGSILIPKTTMSNNVPTLKPNPNPINALLIDLTISPKYSCTLLPFSFYYDKHIVNVFLTEHGKYYHLGNSIYKIFKSFKVEICEITENKNIFVFDNIYYTSTFEKTNNEQELNLIQEYINKRKSNV